MLVRVLLVLVLFAASSHACVIESFTISPTSGYTAEVTVVTLTCSSNPTCRGYFQIKGTDIPNTAIIFNESNITREVQLKTSGEHVYECEFVRNNAVDVRTLQNIRVAKAPCAITKFKAIPTSSTTFTLTCSLGSCTGTIAIYNTTTADADTFLIQKSTKTASVAIIHERSGSFNYACGLIKDGKLEKKQITLKYTRPCGIEEFRYSYTSSNSISILCRTNCSGSVQITGPPNYQSPNPFLSYYKGGFLQQNINNITFSQSGTYSCQFTSVTSTGSQTYSRNLEVEVGCQSPTIMVSDTTAIIGQRITLTCDAVHSCEGTIRLELIHQASRTIVEQSGNSSALLRHTFTGNTTSDYLFICALETTKGLLVSKEVTVLFGKCEVGEVYTACGSACGVSRCSDVANGDVCITKKVCSPMCRCPDSRPYWFEWQEKEADGRRGECVGDCEAAAALHLTDNSSKLTWLIVLIIVLTAIIVIIIIYCCCRLFIRRRQRKEREMKQVENPTVYQNKASRSSPTLNNIYEMEDDAIYAEEGDIQYSEGKDVQYDYDHYLAPDARPPPPPAGAPPQLPDAPIPSEQPQYVNKPISVRDNDNNDNSPDVLNNLAFSFKDKDIVYENN